MANTAVPWIYLSVYLSIYIYYIYICLFLCICTYIIIYIYFFFAWADEKSERRAPSIEFKGETVRSGLLGSGIRRLLQPS